MGIDGIYVINLSRRTDRWEAIQKSFENTKLVLRRWEAIDGTKLSEDQLRDMSTPMGYQICSNSMIAIWQSHYTLWKHISQSKDDNVLILEDDAYPTEDFSTFDNIFSSSVPDNYDVLYLGSRVSGERHFLNFFSGNDRINANVYVPGLPLGLHAYMLTKDFATRLVSIPGINKASYHLDVVLVLSVYNSLKAKVYSFVEPIVLTNREDLSDNVTSTHPIMDKLAYRLGGSYLEYEIQNTVLYIRKLGVTISALTIGITTAAIVSCWLGNTVSITVLLVLSILFAYEYVSYTSTSLKQSICDILPMLLMVLLCTYI